MIELWFDGYDGPEHVGDYETTQKAMEMMRVYLETEVKLNHPPYYYNIHEYKNGDESGLHIDYGSYTRFFRLVNAKMSDLR